MTSPHAQPLLPGRDTPSGDDDDGNIQPWQKAGVAEGSAEKAVASTRIAHWDLADPEVLEHANFVYNKKGEPAFYGRCVGPTFPDLWRCFFSSVAAQVLVFLTGYLQMHCDGRKVDYLPLHRWVWMFLIWAVLHCYLEFKCLRYSILSFAQIVGRFKVLGIDVNLIAWLFYNFGLSFFYVLAVSTHSLVTARWIVEENSTCRDKMADDIWGATLSESWFFPYFSHMHVSLYVVMIWLHTELKTICVSIQFWPKRGEQQRCCLPQAGKVMSQNWKMVHNIESWHGWTWLGKEISPSNLFFRLGEAAGMATIGNQAIQQRICFLHWKINSSVKPNMATSGTQLKRLLPDMNSLFWHARFRIIFIFVLRVIFPMNVQTSLLALDCVTPGKIDRTAFLYLLIGIVGALPVLASFIQICKLWYWDVLPACNKYGVQKDKDGYNVKWNFCWFMLLLILSTCLFFYTVVKFCMLFFCPHALWNFPTGCAQLKGLNVGENKCLLFK